MPTCHSSPDLEMHYRIDDFTDPWTEPETILMLHGNCESGTAWYAWVPHLARCFRVVRPDMRGYGAFVLSENSYHVATGDPERCTQATLRFVSRGR